jgi:hypothetical protein
LFRRRVGFAQATETTTLSIPANIEQLQDSFYVFDAERTAPDWDFMWNALIEEGREKRLKQMPLSRCPEPLPCSISGENDEISVAEAALKVLLLLSVMKFIDLLVLLESDDNGRTL